MVKLKFHGSSFLVASSLHLRRHARQERHHREDAIRECRACWATSPMCLPRAYPIGRPAVCCGLGLGFSAARSSVCHVVLQSPRARHARLVADKSLASSSDTFGTPDFLVICYQHPRYDATKMLPVNCSRGISA